MIKKMFLYLFIRFGITTSWPEQKQSYPFTSLKQNNLQQFTNQMWNWKCTSKIYLNNKKSNTLLWFTLEGFGANDARLCNFKHVWNFLQ